MINMQLNYNEDKIRVLKVEKTYLEELEMEAISARLS